MKFSVGILHILILLAFASHGAAKRNKLDKPPIKSFKKNGDVIDCINIYEQPAFDHPLLRNHKLQMRPSSFPKQTKPPSKKDSTRSAYATRGEVEGCPYGSVPFRRILKEDLIRGTTVMDIQRSKLDSQVPNLSSDFHYAAVTTPVNDLSRQFFGAQTTISVYNFTVHAPQFTEAMLWVGTAVDGPYNSIEYGWTINPQLYGDSEPRTYSLWTADGLKQTGCYNALCPGYVQVSQKRIMGEINKLVSVFGESVSAMEFTIFKDKKTGNWWLVENLGDTKNEPVGYWPKELFPAMTDSAKVVQLGGKVYSPSNMTERAPMGTGIFIEDDYTRTCYASNNAFINHDNQFYLPNDVSMQQTADIPNTYKAHYLGDVTKNTRLEGIPYCLGDLTLKIKVDQ